MLVELLAGVGSIDADEARLPFRDGGAGLVDDPFALIFPTPDIITINAP